MKNTKSIILVLTILLAFSCSDDDNVSDTFEEVSIPGSKNIPYDELVGRMDELDKNHPSIFFCNGPQCPQSSTAIKRIFGGFFSSDVEQLVNKPALKQNKNKIIIFLIFAEFFNTLIVIPFLSF